MVRHIALGAMALMCLLFSGNGDVVNEDFKLVASNGAEGDKFGHAVSIDGDTAVIGAYRNENHPCCPNAGAAYVFRFDGSQWIEEAQLLASDGSANDEFGFSVSISNNAIVIGAWGDDATNGSAYVFRFNGSQWVEEAKLLPPDREVNDRFGCSVSIDGDTAVIGAYGDDNNGSNSGSAYVFRFDGKQWTQDALLLASDGSSQDYFGYSVSISDDTALIGSAYDDNNGTQAGSAYVFRLVGSQWIEEARLLASDGSKYDEFGLSVSISDDTALIGSPYDDDNGAQAGSAYVFHFNGKQWIEEAKLLASDASKYDEFGYSVSISGDMAVIGSIYDDDNGTYSGAAYAFRLEGNEWLEEAKLLASDGEYKAYFGYSVSISGDTALIGSPYDDDSGAYSGSAYVFELDDLYDLKGACCTNDLCVITDEDSCNFYGGAWYGEGTTCEDVVCPVDCLGDVNNDGYVDVTDILAVIAAWGPCKNCPEDFDGNGVVEVTDIFIVMANWGSCP